MTDVTPDRLGQQAHANLPSRFRRVLPLAIGLALFALGIYALFHLLKSVNAKDVAVQMRITPWATLAAAIGATFLGYVSLLGYDWSALRYLGKKVPARVIAIGGFLGYSFGNTIGLSVVSGGAVRYRIYSAFGLNAFEVAAVSTFVSIAFGIGITIIGLGALALHPYALESVLPWSATATQRMAALVFAGVVATLAWLSFSGKTLSIRSWDIAAPSPGILLGQLAFTLFDTVFAALTLYVLLPAGAPDFITVLAVFAAAAMVGVVSHVPGGVGVFETVVIASMPAGTSLDQVAAALLLYRIIYYLVPFALALAFVAINEARLAGGLVARLLGDVPVQMRPLVRTITSVAPSITGTATFGLGIYLLLMALLPAVRPEDIDPNDFLAAILLEGGALMSAALGIILVLLSQGLLRRISGAFWLTEVSLLAGAIASVLNGLDFESAALLFLSAAILWPFRAEFSRSAKLTHDVLSPEWFVLVAAIALAAGGFFFFIHESTPYSTDLWTQFAGGANTPRALRAALLATAILCLFTIYLALQPARAHSHRPDKTSLDKANAIILAQENPTGFLALSGDKSLFFSDAEDAFIMYAIQGRSWVAYSDPVGRPGAFKDLLWAFKDAAYAANSRPVLYEITEQLLPLCVEMGMTLHKIGEEADVDVQNFSLAGAKFKKMRAAYNKSQKSGLEFEVLDAPHSDALMQEIQLVSDAWLGARKGAEKGFSVGRFDAEYLQNFPIALVRRDQRVIAFANVMRPSDGKRITIDLMRYLPDEASGMMEYLFIALIEHYRVLGAQSFSLGMAPLSGIQARQGARLWSRFGALLFRHGGAFYNFEGLRAFKQKFQPDWHPRFVAVPGGASLLIALKDVAVLIAGGARGLISK
ncbi:MAG: bifunctional lysylphosphatidylglycerol flippase/synthetase MprF [Albidovulum sp.]